MRLLLGNLGFFCLICFPPVLHTASLPETDRARCSAALPGPACWRSEVLGVSALTSSGRALPNEKRLEARASLACTRHSASAVVLLDVPDHRVRLPLLDGLEGLAQRGYARH